MVARGDLGVEVPMQDVPLIQKSLVQRAKQARIPVIIATQMLDSMIKKPIPTRAEVSDIANSIIDGADALLVTGETAVGDYPKEVISMLSKVIQETEKSISYNNKMIAHDTIVSTAGAISHAGHVQWQKILA